MKHMKLAGCMGAFLLIVLVGCTGMTASSRLEIFNDIQRAYRLALRDADFKAAALVLDPATQSEPNSHQRYEGFKVVQYTATKIEPSENGSEIRQEVEIEYYHQNRPVLKTLVDNQLWRYQPDNKNWLLQTGLPKFKIE